MYVIYMVGKKYFATFIDDCTRFCYVYLMHSKDEVLDKFKMFKAQVVLQHETFIKCFRNNRGGEFYHQVTLNPLVLCIKLLHPTSHNKIE